jgi:phosphatidate cytidylyltransferase
VSESVHPGARRRPVGSEGFTRVLFGFGMAIIAVGVLVYSSAWFAGLVMLIVAFAAREWHRLVRIRREESEDQALLIQTLVTIGVVGAALVLLLLRHETWLASVAALCIPAAFLVLALGAAASFIAGRNREDNPFWHAGGVLYIGLAAMALVALRDIPTAPRGTEIVLGLFLIVWSTDTGALVFGKLIGGKKLAPAISPGKTWAGTIGGSVCAALVYGLYIAFFSFPLLPAMLFALLFSATAHLGDLFESLVKRRCGTKDSGGLIPGHGGALDRMDSTFAAAPVMALLVFGLHFNPLFGGHL